MCVCVKPNFRQRPWTQNNWVKATLLVFLSPEGESNFRLVAPIVGVALGVALLIVVGVCCFARRSWSDRDGGSQRSGRAKSSYLSDYSGQCAEVTTGSPGSKPCWGDWSN